jgi:hypothetical protein
MRGSDDFGGPSVEPGKERQRRLPRLFADGRIPIDNNIIERFLRPVAIGRKTLGPGSVRLYELLGLIKDVGGLKKFKDLVEAISGTETDAIPF